MPSGVSPGWMTRAVMPSVQAEADTSKRADLPSCVRPVAGRELVLDQPVGGRGVRHAQQRLGQHHQRQTLLGRERIGVQEILDAAEPAGLRRGSPRSAAGRARRCGLRPPRRAAPRPAKRPRERLVRRRIGRAERRQRRRCRSAACRASSSQACQRARSRRILADARDRMRLTRLRCQPMRHAAVQKCATSCAGAVHAAAYACSFVAACSLLMQSSMSAGRRRIARVRRADRPRQNDQERTPGDRRKRRADRLRPAAASLLAAAATGPRPARRHADQIHARLQVRRPVGAVPGRRSTRATSRPKASTSPSTPPPARSSRSTASPPAPTTWASATSTR